MSKSVKKWAIKARRELMDKLGPKCAWCGLTEEEAEDDGTYLTFDCIVPVGNDHHKGSTDQRMVFYRKQHFEHDNVQVLCLSCNGMKQDSCVDFRTVPELNWSHLGDLTPF